MKVARSIAVVGAGFFGLMTALHLARKGFEVSIYERNSKPMQEASLFNQARVHGGYHYPRSLITAARCRANFNRFVEDFQGAIYDDFESIYAITGDSKVNTQKFLRLMSMIGSPIYQIDPKLKNEFNLSLIVSAFRTQELAFNSELLLKLTLERLAQENVQFFYDTEVVNIYNTEISGNNFISIQTKDGENERYGSAVIATYGLDDLNSTHDFNRNYLYEVCELVRVEVPSVLARYAITVVDGPFWSVTPWPAFHSHVLTHVRFTPHARFRNYLEAKEFLDQLKLSRSEMILKDVSRYLPRMTQCKVLGSEFTIKTILRKSDLDDARPIYVQQENRILSILGSKIDNIYDLEGVLDNFIKDRENR